MRIVKNLPIIVLLLLAPFASATVYQSIDRDDIRAGETFVLDIRVENASDEEPDLSMLPSKLTIVGNSQYQNTQIFNGRRTSVRGWKIKLKAIQAGKITIPAMDVAGEKTKPITVTIKPSTDRVSVNGQKKAIFLTAEVDAKESWVQQQILYTLKLYRSVNTHYASLTEPFAEDAIIEKLGDDSQYETQINNRRYVVTERRYALFPQKSGDFVINPVNFTADVSDNSRRGFGNYLSATRPVSISTEKLKVNVKPQPASISGDWLPASELSLEENWQPADMSMRVGDPTTWTIKLFAHGLSEDQLPEIKVPDTAGLQFYADSPQKERDNDKSGIIGQRIQKFAVIPAKAGDFELPEITVKWWDTHSNKLRIASIPARKVSVKPSDKTRQNPGSPIQTIPHESQKGKMIAPSTVVTSNSMAGNERLWQFISALLAVGWLLTVIILRRPADSDEKSVSGVLSSASTAQLRKDLLTALNRADPILSSQYLLKWLNAVIASDFHSIGSIIRQLGDDSLVSKLNALEAACFSDAAQDQTINVEDWKLSASELNQLTDELANSNKTSAPGDLPSLYQ